MNLLLVDEAEISGAGEVVLVGTRSKHVREVLRADVGSELRVGCIDGPIGRARVTAIENDRVHLACSFDGAPPKIPPVDLLLALPRPKVMARLWSQLAAIGVGTILLTNAERVERYYFDSHTLRPELRREPLLEGLSQARDTRVPHVQVCKELKPLVEDRLDELFPDHRRILTDPAYRRSIRETVRARPGKILVAIGPEGGWSGYERDMLERHGFTGVSLGPRTLRSDTAVVAILSIVHDALAHP
jgi:16S rRNA (uracil1498-N3)-methyltransferase